MAKGHSVCVYVGEALGRYGFGDEHPFGPERMGVFWDRMISQGLDAVVAVHDPVCAERADIERFHTPEYVDKVIRQSESGTGYLDYGDTPAFPGVYEAAAHVVGSAVDAARQLMDQQCRHTFIPIAGLHHARRNVAGGFCVFNDCGVVIEMLRSEYGLKRVAYVDIDAHHGDGVFYGFEEDPDLLFADIHEDGRYLYPGTGAADESGRGLAKGTKLNIPMPPGADDDQFLVAWQRVEDYLRAGRPEFIILQCGADSVRGDPITHMCYTPAAHAHAATRLAGIANEFCDGRLLALGGGGYNHQNIALAWTAVVRSLLDAA
ncbi:MAG: acetoin utilization protein AcuC [Proteobacteria bacterium]|nr:MAG: acetoin utilization protein AcuC [Pseudomonadota bacterium]QKK11564.1 MAG: acetoin utilization protein AcuC [Pseudomonadota bacterium]